MGYKRVPDPPASMIPFMLKVLDDYFSFKFSLIDTNYLIIFYVSTNIREIQG